MTTDRTEQGRELRNQIFGKALTDDHIANASWFMQPVQDIVTDVCFGEIWSRPGLDKRTRSLITLAMLAAQGRAHEIRIHTRGAIANGVTKEELRELFVHVFPYCGLPLMVDGMRGVEETLKAIEQEKANG